MNPTLILPLDSAAASLAVAGGKGANLARLARAGLPVPRGFLLTTRAYDTYLAANHLAGPIRAALEGINPGDPKGLEAASEAIRALFAAGTMPADLAAALRDAYAALGRPPVAVRSSATAEDLPDLSFAGQQETYLNVIGDGELLRTVVGCWASLWTARAIGYRARNAIPQEGLTLAVVVQEMVPSEVSGVLFTANPLTGRRTETVIDATLGLGEALVAGRVEPDHYVIDTASGRLLGKTIGAKALSVRGKPGGGTVDVAEDAAGRQALPDGAILELAGLGRRAAELFGTPQDVEWAWSGGRFSLLQSRPITSLYPLPEGLPPEPLRVLLSVGGPQGMLDPITPLGQDVFRAVAAAVSSLFGSRATYETQRLLSVAGERLFADLTPWLRFYQRFSNATAMWSLVDPGLTAPLAQLGSDPRLPRHGSGMPWGALWRGAGILAPALGRLLFNLLWPDAGRARTLRRVEGLVAALEARGAATTDLRQGLRLLQDALRRIPRTLAGLFVPVLWAGLGSLYLLHRLARGLPDSGRLVLEVTRGLPHNVTTEMDLALWETARAIQADPAAAEYFSRTEAATLAADFLAGRLPPVAQAAVAGFLRRYGMRGPAEIDLGRPRWREDPTMILQVLQSYLSIKDAGRAPDRVFARGATAAEAAVARLAAEVQGTRGGRLKARLVRWAARRVRALAGLREAPKFFIIRLFGGIRNALLDSGRQLAAAGVLDRPDNLFFLHLAELQALAGGERRDWRALVAGRRQAYAREKRRRQVPRLLLSDGQAFYEGVAGPAEPGKDFLAGSPVSPGVAEGAVRVVLDPHGARLAPGEILVCPGTDPGWTPLFLAAGGLVTEVGGLITHGSVVAREYGIPAVVGVHQATTRLRTGQRVRVDGTNGRVEVLGDAGSSGG